MKKIVMVLIVLSFWIFSQKILAGGVIMDFQALDEKTASFAGEFILEMQKKKSVIDKFGGEYVVRGYVGASQSKETGETKSAIGIFINDEEQPVTIIWFDELLSREEIKKKAKEAAGCVFEYLRKLDEKKKAIKVLV